MNHASLGLAERFLPLVYCEHNDRSICYQNILDLQETELLARLERLNETIALTPPLQQKQSGNAEEIAAFNQFVQAMRDAADADALSHAGHLQAEEILAYNPQGAVSLGVQHFLLKRIEKSLCAIVIRFGDRIEGCKDTCGEAFKTLSRDHVMEFYRTLEIVPGSIHDAGDPINEVIVNVPRMQNGKQLSEKEQRALFAYTLEMLKLYCYPGIHRTGFAASLTPVVTLGSIGVMKYAENKGFEMLHQVLREQTLHDSGTSAVSKDCNSTDSPITAE